tara:strand:- start:437 stop:541 length:105 start_codon:yes stop_codon:yes gene_type:complete
MVHLVHLKMRVLNIRDGGKFANEPNKIIDISKNK